jgi:hypothetical protein
MRLADRTAARDALERWLPDLASDERAAVTEALEEGLGPDDEAFLAQAFGDRRAEVRRAAAGLLARLEDSELTRLVEARARPLLASQGKVQPSLAVTLPTLDPELEAAGFGGKAPAGVGERAWLLRQLLGHVRPSRWTEWLRAEPPALVERAMRADEVRPILEGWLEAATRFADPAWVAALVADPKVAAAVHVDVAWTLEALPIEQRLAVAASAARSVDPSVLARIAAACPPPWPAPLVDPVLRALGKLATEQYPDQGFYALGRAAALGIPPSRATDLLTVASREGQVRPALVGAMDLLGLRERIHDAFASLPPA